MTQVSVQRHSLEPELSQSGLMTAGITAPARAHVSITANLIICQCASLKSIPVSFHLNISWERHTSESKTVSYHVWLGSSDTVSTHVHHLTLISVTGEMPISMKMSQREPSFSTDVLCPMCIIDPLQFHDNAWQVQREMPQSYFIPLVTVLLTGTKQSHSKCFPPKRSIWVWFSLLVFLSQTNYS